MVDDVEADRRDALPRRVRELGAYGLGANGSGIGGLKRLPEVVKKFVEIIMTNGVDQAIGGDVGSWFSFGWLLLAVGGRWSPGACFNQTLGVVVVDKARRLTDGTCTMELVESFL